MITSQEFNCLIKTNNGQIRGYMKTDGDKIYYKFKGIPYAKPPLGKLRFMPPCPVQPWTETIECTKDPPPPLYYSRHGQLQGSEDCLYIDISTPNTSPDKLMPVMFWIGCYSFSMIIDDMLEPFLINDQDVIIVRCGFRMGPFGFLSINDYTAPGNAGLKDVVMALKWIQLNIYHFGGDCNNVTVFGNSAGGAIVHFLMLSPMATGLFHKAIIQSASALNKWSIANKPLHAVVELAKQLGFDETTEAVEIIDKLRLIPATDIMDAFRVLDKKSFKKHDNDLFDCVFKPCIEEEFEGQSAFINKSPCLILKSGNFNKVPMIIGSNNIEASLLQFIKSDFYCDFEHYNKNVELLVPRSLAGDENLAKNIGHQLLNFYLSGGKALTKDTRNQYLQLLSDYYFLYYVNKTVRLHSQFAPECPIYYYVMNCVGEWSVPKELDMFNSLGHCAELPFIFGIKVPGQPICKGSRDSVKTRARVVKMWTNFAKYGNPTPNDEDPLLQITWDPVENKDKLNYISLGSELTKGRNPFHERMLFWEDLHREHTFLRVLVYFNDLGVPT